MRRRSLLLLPLASPALAQIERPLRLIVPFAAGTSSDLQARLIAQHMGPYLPHPVVVENRAGGGGVLGAEAVARATDGHSLLLGSNGPLVNNPVLRADIPYRVPEDFAPIGLISRSPLTLTVRADSPIRDVAGWVAAARRGDLSIGSSGQGTATHLLIEQLFAAAGVRATHVPYRGSSLSVPDVVAGTIASVMAEISTVYPLWRDGRLRVLATTGPRRSVLMPDVPTLIEAGYPGLTGGSWAALVGPAAMPMAVQAAVVAAQARAMETPAFLARQRELGADVAAPEERGPQALLAFWQAELARTRATVAAAGIRAE
ncbi:MAG: tripartite tricarboxylate transporter substrate binding protein [Rhodovarius sp.]|nr:tripartite tricarboxylate transporter substrate binding protein [Rhodovarius sp.]MDW8313530.1 tripartite tricarboxylate transporter substrate binding protein [Rhodovarius sp.]